MLSWLHAKFTKYYFLTNKISTSFLLNRLSLLHHVFLNEGKGLGKELSISRLIMRKTRIREVNFIPLYDSK